MKVNDIVQDKDGQIYKIIEVAGLWRGFKLVIESLDTDKSKWDVNTESVKLADLSQLEQIIYGVK